MSTNLQKVDSNAQPRSQLMLQGINKDLHRQNFRKVLDILPSYEIHDIFQDDNGDLMFRFGHVEGSNKEPILFSIKGWTNWPHVREKKKPWESDIIFVNSHAMGDKAPFDWSSYLYGGLFKEFPKTETSGAEPSGSETTMLGPSRALLDYYFLQWAANSPNAANFCLPETFTFNSEKREKLASALTNLLSVDHVRDSILKNQEDQTTTPSPGYTSSEDILISSSEGSKTMPQRPGGTLSSATYSALKSGTGTVQKDSDISRTLHKIRKSITNLTSLPPLEDIQIEDSTEDGRENLLPLRLCIGHKGKHKVWMYIEKEVGRPWFEIETSHPEQGGTGRVVLKEEPDLEINGITLLEPFRTGKAGGLYIDPMINIGKYYFFLACEAWDLDLRKKDIVKDKKFEQYLKTGANAYHTQYRRAQSQREEVSGNEGIVETTEAVRTPTGLQTSPGGLSTPKTSHQTVLSPTSPPLDQQGPAYELGPRLESPDLAESLDMNQLEKKKNELLKRKKSLDDQIGHHRQAIKKAEEMRDQTDAELREIEDIKNENQPQV
ncbi:hypothetical protein P171DRAFT_448243 [Karstenula rhodostoma CBS 690.94]|uniref:Uncharacterized protein n=1 Tax=Karstenula rhodostoma CBS 690.94 TaxID=1392251 RepID=A0A9P4P8H8_9PLEO|nr:hypothetical protein P171DRAFT_448243 [Karstenula rhodostoma CBS 690.94]